MLTDVAYGTYGHNKFYKIQLLERLDSKKWFVWTKWGRVGADGSEAMNEFYKRVEAQAYFEKKFKTKTDNEWAHRELFKKMPGKYHMINKEEEKEGI
jgi:poly [ADP-ribose] polymerase